MLNGINKKVCILRYHNDTFLHFETDKIVLLDEKTHDLEKFCSIFDEYIKDYTVLIDARMTYYVLYGYLKYGMNLLIYDPMRAIIYTFVDYASIILCIDKLDLPICKLKLICAIKLFLDFACAHLNIRSKITSVVKILSESKDEMQIDKHTIIKCCIELIGIQSSCRVDNETVKTYINTIDDILKCKQYREDLPKITLDQLYSLLIMSLSVI